MTPARAPIEILGAAEVLPAPEPVARPPLPGTACGAPAVYLCPETVGTGVIPPGEYRRLGRSQKLAMTAARLALAECAAPPLTGDRAALCVGTAVGIVEETAAFLENLIERNEAEPRPARFINSVHNSIASRMAIALTCRGENHTFTHQAVSFELALWQGVHLLRAGRADQVVVAGVDESSPYGVALGAVGGWWRAEAAPLHPLSDRKTGTLPGEGAGAVIICRADPAPKAGATRLALLRQEALPRRQSARPDPAVETQFIERALAQAGVRVAEVDFFLLSANGDARTDALYAGVLDALGGLAGRPVSYGTYKQWCGEFCTASAVGLALATQAVRQGALRDGLLAPGAPAPERAPRTVALYGFLETGYRSLCLVTA